MRYSIHHETCCRFDRLVSYSIRNLRLTPREEAGQRVEKWHVSTPVRSVRTVDAWGNTAHLLTLTEPHDEVRIVVSGVIETTETAGPYLRGDQAAVSPFTFMPETLLTQASEVIHRFADKHFQTKRAEYLLASVIALKALIPWVEDADTVGAAQATARQFGNLHDLAHAFIAACRCVGLPARFVSGFLLGERATVHAWADVWLASENAWLSIDLQRECLSDDRLVRLAVGRDYLDACPMRTAHQGSGHEAVEVLVLAE